MTERNGVGEGRKRMGEEETEHMELKERDGFTNKLRLSTR